MNVDIHTVITMGATLVSPFIAVFAQSWINKRREVRHRRLELFKTLFTGVHNRSENFYIQAFRLIRIEFSHEKAIIEKWQEHVACIARPIPPDAKGEAQWYVEEETSLYELLMLIAKKIDFHLDPLDLQQANYWNKAGKVEADIKRGLANWLVGASKPKVETYVVDPSA